MLCSSQHHRPLALFSRLADDQVARASLTDKSDSGTASHGIWLRIMSCIFIVLFGPTLAAMCTCALSLKKLSKIASTATLSF